MISCIKSMYKTCPVCTLIEFIESNWLFLLLPIKKTAGSPLKVGQVITCGKCQTCVLMSPRDMSVMVSRKDCVTLGRGNAITLCFALDWLRKCLTIFGLVTSKCKREKNNSRRFVCFGLPFCGNNLRNVLNLVKWSIPCLWLPLSVFPWVCFQFHLVVFFY